MAANFAEDMFALVQNFLNRDQRHDFAEYAEGPLRHLSMRAFTTPCRQVLILQSRTRPIMVLHVLLW